MISLRIAGPAELRWAQQQVRAHHYLRAPVDPRCRPLAYVVELHYPEMLPQRVGCLIFGWPEATRCYQGELTYGSQADVASGRARHDRWSVLNLARVWLHPHVQTGGVWYRSDLLPGYHDRSGLWRSALASWCVGQALTQVGYDYLVAHPPVWIEQPYRIEVVLSYCDTNRHKGTIYRAAGFNLARTNPRGIETWYTTAAVGALTAEQDARIRRLAERCQRSQTKRAARAVPAEQETLAL